MTKTAILVHPDSIARAALGAKLATRYPCLAIAGTAADNARGAALIRQLKPDFAFVEAGLSERPCFQAFEEFDAKLLALDLPPARLIAFAFRGGWAEAFGYLLRPAGGGVGAESGQRTTSHVITPSPCSKTLSEWQETIFFFSDTQGEIPVALKNLIRVEANDRKTFAYVAGWPQPVLSPLGINDLAKALQAVPFLFRSHRSHLVNLYHLKQHQKQAGLLIMTSHNGENGTKAVLAEGRRAAFQQAMVHLGWQEIKGKNAD
jgi:DNA-binding LytR/AlgR family response regulator